MVWERGARLAGWRSRLAGDDVDEQSVHSAVTGHFGVKRRRQHLVLADCDDVVGGSAEHLHVRTDPFDPWCPNEHRVHRSVEAVEVDVALEGVDLPAKGVAP